MHGHESGASPDISLPEPPGETWEFDFLLIGPWSGAGRFAMGSCPTGSTRSLDTPFGPKGRYAGTLTQVTGAIRATLQKNEVQLVRYFRNFF